MLLRTPPCKSCRQSAVKKKSTIKVSQEPGSVLFDGADPDLPAKDFGPDAKTAGELTGAGGQIPDLKSYEPDIKKTSPVTEFSLANKSSALPATAPPANTAVAAQKAEAAEPDDSYITCVVARDALVEQYAGLIREQEEAVAADRNKVDILKKGGGVCGKTSGEHISDEYCLFMISEAKAALKASLDQVEVLRATQKSYAESPCGEPGCLEGEIRNAETGICECPPGTTEAADGACKAEPETEPGDELGHDFPYGPLGWASIIGLLAGIGLVLGGSVWGNLVLIIFGLLFVLVSIGGLMFAKRWATRKVAEIKKMQVKQIIEGDLNQRSAADLQKAGDIESNDILQKNITSMIMT